MGLTPASIDRRAFTILEPIGIVAAISAFYVHADLESAFLDRFAARPHHRAPTRNAFPAAAWSGDTSRRGSNR
jgi:hypothetical protein